MTIDRYHGQLQTNHDPSGNRGNHVITGFNPVVDAAALSAFGASQLPADRNRVIEQTAGAAATEAAGRGLYYADGLGGWKRLDPEHARALAASGVAAAEAAQADADTLAAAQFPGHSRLQRYSGPAPVEILNTQSHDVPGPSAGFIRVFVDLHVYTSGATASAVSWQIYNGVTPGLQLKRDVSMVVTQGYPTSATGFVAGALVLGAGESLRVGNTGTNPNTGSLTLWYRYYDLPADGYTLVRAQLSGATPVTIIPTPDAGFYARVAKAGAPFPLLNATNGALPLCVARNDDSASAQIEAFLGGVFAGRSLNGNTNTDYTALPLVNDVEITDQALTLALRASVAARPVNIALCYETLPIP